VAVVIGEVSLALGLGAAYVAALPTHRLALGVVPRCAVATGAAIGAALVLDVHSVVASAVASGVYFAIALVLRAIPEELLQEVRR
jgi:hypothetical protein